MKNIIVLLLIVAITFAAAFGTSSFLTWAWVQAHWTRSFLIILLMLLQLAFGAMLVWQYLKTSFKVNKVNPKQ